jgi:pimeloyl-ACP methyl ester carboxylesterase
MQRTLLAGLLAFGCAFAGSWAGAQADAPTATPAAKPTATCPASVPAETLCFSGKDSAGASYWIAKPATWNGVLVLHAHGGPELGEPRAERSAEDLKRWVVMLKAGYAWAGSTYRQGGVAVHAAAEDTERLRTIFTERVGKPRLTILHGQSWGASVAAVGAQMFPKSYDGVLLTSGVLGGGTQSYNFRLDLRVVYQALCGNHPLPNEPSYPLWHGLPLDAKLTHGELARRVDQCTGLRFKPGQRSAEQQQKLDTLLKVVRIPERSLIGHLNWATWHFQDVAFKRAGGRNVFGNLNARYSGSPDDAALNAMVQRYAADPQAVAQFAADTDPGGRIGVPVLTVHAIDDPVAFVELESTFRETMHKAGSAEHLVQTFTDDHEHTYLSDPQYAAAMQALLGWVERGEKPTPQSVAERCTALEAAFGPGCRFVPDYRSAPLSQRVAPR